MTDHDPHFTDFPPLPANESNPTLYPATAGVPFFGAAHSGTVPPTGSGKTPGSPPSRGVKPKTWLAAAALAALVAVVSLLALDATSNASAVTPTDGPQTTTSNAPASTAAGPRKGSGRGIAGTVASIDGTTLTVTSQKPGDHRPGGAADEGTGGDTNATATTYTVKTTATTRFTKTEDGKVSDFAKGDTIVVIGTNTNGTVAATRISQTDGKAPDKGIAPKQGGRSDRQPGHSGRHGEVTVGTITMVKGSTLTLESRSGDSVTVTTSSDTAVSVNHEVALKAIKKGDKVHVIGTVSGTTVEAAAVRFGDTAGPGCTGNRMGGPKSRLHAAPGDGSKAPATTSQAS